ncbi:MAG: hypothetical protein EA366_06445 [Spirulina sp. DLM2.Bin59]|nr:MAG: hypothetical protein EA366_06445 [Spirulina sp. DLM2.Bin59]
MLPALKLLPGSIAEMLATARQTGQINRADQYGLMAAVLEESLSEDEVRAINRLLRSVKQGKVQVREDI